MGLKITDMDPTFKDEIGKKAGAEKVTMCFQCGTCTADCPIARSSSLYRPRKLIRMAQLGMKKRLLSDDSLWLCTACFTCIDHCPQDVGIAGLVRALRNLTAKKGSMPSVFRELATNIQKTGYAYMIPDLRLKRREKQGLPSLPKANVKSITKLFKLNKFPPEQDEAKDGKTR